MKIASLVIVICFLGCQDSGVEPQYHATFQERDITNFQGVIQEVSSTLYVIVPEPYLSTTEAFIPLNLPANFRVHNLHVVVSGRTKIIPLSVAYPGTPLEVSSIVIRQ
jgi:hypothetical protein